MPLCRFVWITTALDYTLTPRLATNEAGRQPLPLSLLAGEGRLDAGWSARGASRPWPCSHSASGGEAGAPWLFVLENEQAGMGAMDADFRILLHNTELYSVYKVQIERMF